MAERRVYSKVARNAAALLGAQTREARIARGWTIVELADRASLSKNTVVKVEHGDPSVALGIAFELASLCGVTLFFDDPARLAWEARAARERLTLLPRRARPPGPEPDYDF